MSDLLTFALAVVHAVDPDHDHPVMTDAIVHVVEDDGRTLLRPGDIAAWAKGVPNGHHLINESDRECTFVVVSAGAQMGAAYSDIDLMVTADGHYSTKDGSKFPSVPRTPSWIAEQSVVFLYADGRRVPGRIALGAPHDDGRSSTCVIALDGISDELAPKTPVHGDTTLQAQGLGSYIQQMTTAGDFPRIALGIGVMCVFVMALNHWVWRRLYRIAEERMHF